MMKLDASCLDINMPKPNPVPAICRRLSKSLTDLEQSELERDQSYQALKQALERAEMAAKNMQTVRKGKKERKREQTR